MPKSKSEATKRKKDN